MLVKWKSLMTLLKKEGNSLLKETQKRLNYGILKETVANLNIPLHENAIKDAPEANVVKGNVTHWEFRFFSGFRVNWCHYEELGQLDLIKVL